MQFATVRDWMQQSIGAAARPGFIPPALNLSSVLQGKQYGENGECGGASGVGWGCDEDAGNETARGDHPSRLDPRFSSDPTVRVLDPASLERQVPYDPSSGRAGEPKQDSSDIALETLPPSGPRSPASGNQKLLSQTRVPSAAMGQPATPAYTLVSSIPESPGYQRNGQLSPAQREESLEMLARRAQDLDISFADASPWMPRTHALRRIIGEIGIEVPNQEPAEVQVRSPTSRQRDENDPAIVLL